MAERDRQAHARIVNPGPIDTSVLVLQDRHISQRVWNRLENSDRTLVPRRCTFNHVNAGLPPLQIVPHLRRAGFYGVSRIIPFEYDGSFITALIDRWRLETHTFHMPQGECTITLQDVAIQFGLPCDGDPVVGATDYNWRQLAKELLGVMPPVENMSGQRVRMTWLTSTFRELPPHPTEEQLVQFTRAYILRLIGGLLMPDHSGNFVQLMYLQFLRDLDRCGQYSWGAAVLAHLYHEMCFATDLDAKEISSCLTLLHVWAWDRFPRLAPRSSVVQDHYATENIPPPPLAFRWGKVHRNFQPLRWYRRWFDMSSQADLLWQPYDNAAVRALIPDYCVAMPAVWRSSCPLLCMHIVRWHQPDRVLRQFGMDQLIPYPAVNLDDIGFHGKDLRGRTGVDWSVQHRKFIDLWNRRYTRIFDVGQPARPLNINSEYWQWYQKITRRWMDPINGSVTYAVDKLAELQQITQDPPPNYPDFCAQVNNICRDLLGALGEHHAYLLGERVEAPIRPEVPSAEIVPNQPRPKKKRSQRGYFSAREPEANIFKQPPPTHEDPPRRPFHVLSPAHEELSGHSFYVPSTAPEGSE